MLDRNHNLDVVSVYAFELHNLDDYSVSGLEMLARICPTLIAEFFQGHIGVNAEQLHKHSRSDNGCDTRFRQCALVKKAISVSVCASVVSAPLLVHCFQSAGDGNVGFLINAFDDVIHLSTESLHYQVSVNLFFRLTTGVFRWFD